MQEKKVYKEKREKKVNLNKSFFTFNAIYMKRTPFSVAVTANRFSLNFNHHLYTHPTQFYSVMPDLTLLLSFIILVSPISIQFSRFSSSSSSTSYSSTTCNTLFTFASMKSFLYLSFDSINLFSSPSSSSIFVIVLYVNIKIFILGFCVWKIFLYTCMYV